MSLPSSQDTSVTINDLLFLTYCKSNITKKETIHLNKRFINMNLYSFWLIICIISEANASGSPKQTALLPCLAPSAIFNLSLLLLKTTSVQLVCSSLSQSSHSSITLLATFLYFKLCVLFIAASDTCCHGDRVGLAAASKQ